MREHSDIERDAAGMNAPNPQAYRPWTPPPTSHFDSGSSIMRFLALPVVIVLVLLALVLVGIATFTTEDDTLDEDIAQILAANNRRLEARARGLSGGVPADSLPAATLTVRSVPTGATVRVDFDSVGTTPLLNYRIPKGVYLVAVESEDGLYADTVASLRDVYDVEHFYFTLRSRDRNDLGFGTDDRLEASASDLPASINSIAEASNTTRDVPVEEPELEPGPAEESATPSERRSTSQQREERAESQSTAREDVARQARTPEPPASGTIVLTSDPPDGVVYVDGRRVGLTPLHLQNVEPGRHKITVMKDGYSPAATNLEVKGGQLVTDHLELAAEMGTLTVLVKPWGSIYIDDELKARDIDVQFTIELPTGEHLIEVVHPALGSRRQPVTIYSGNPQSVVFNLSGVTKEGP